MTALGRLPEFLFRGLVLISAASVAGWLWHCWCVFPYHAWNELRLEPTFLWAQGHPIYAPEDGGPATTWIYGPIPVLLLWPATWATSAAGALTVANALNFIVVAGPIVAIGLTQPKVEHLSRWQRGAVILACLACWPRASFQYLQADNFAVAFGLISLLLLMRNGARPSALWGAALCATAAVACKQTTLEVAAAQLTWLGMTEGRGQVLRHLVRLGTCALLGLGAALTLFDARNLWFNLVTLPGSLPWAEDVLERVATFWPLLAGQLVLPVALLIGLHRLRPDGTQHWRLPALCWLFSLMPGILGFLKVGGSANSWHGVQYLLPFVLPWVWREKNAFRFAGLWRSSLALATLLFAAARLLQLPSIVTRPLTAHLEQGISLARQLPGEAWFPWNPLITFYAVGEFHHTEDGLAIRRLAGMPVSAAQLARHLPPAWHVTAVLTTQAEWGIASSMRPADAQIATLGLWRVESWNPPRSSPAKPTHTPP